MCRTSCKVCRPDRRVLKLIEGRLPKRVVALVLEWAFEHRSELLENWQRAVAQEPLQPIAPLE